MGEVFKDDVRFNTSSWRTTIEAAYCPRSLPSFAKTIYYGTLDGRPENNPFAYDTYRRRSHDESATCLPVTRSLHAGKAEA
jgi:hypothetical protein